MWSTSGDRAMILHIDPSASDWPHATAASLLAFREIAGALALASAGAALAIPKGAASHRAAGRLFVLAMVATAACEAVAGAFLASQIAVVAGVAALYLTATAWLTVRRRPRRAGVIDVYGMMIACAAAAGGIALAMEPNADPSWRLEGLPPQSAWGLAALAGLGAAMDIRVILAGGVSGAQRIARHVWRMGGALLIAAPAVLFGREATLTKGWGSSVLSAAELAIVGLTAFWLLRPRDARDPPAAGRSSAAIKPAWRPAGPRPHARASRPAPGQVRRA
jgi:hypothetical protein